MLPRENENIQESAIDFIDQQVELYGDELALDIETIQTAISAPDWSASSTLAELEENICDCQKCSLAGSRRNFVFGSGHAQADIVLIGEAPGATEDEQGLPFAGEAGKILDRMLTVIARKREDLFLCNVLKCRPPGNRDPLPEEVEQCLPYLLKQLELIKPAFILCLGHTAAKTLLNANQPLASLRGRVHDFHGMRLIVTYHPAALLRHTPYFFDVDKDLKLLRRLYDEYRIGVKGGEV